MRLHAHARLFLTVAGLVAALRAAEPAASPQSAQATAVSATSPSSTPEYEDGYLKLSFDLLASYAFTPPPFDPVAAEAGKAPTGEEQIPASIKALDRSKAVVTGYMVPVKLDKGMVTELLLMRNTLACCFGGVPNMTEWVVVKLRKGVQPLMDTPVSFYGLLKVGAVFENGYLTGLYQMDGDKMAVPKN